MTSTSGSILICQVLTYYLDIIWVACQETISVISLAALFRNHPHGRNSSRKDQLDAERLPNVLSSKCEKAGLGVKVDKSKANSSSKSSGKVARVLGDIHLFDSCCKGESFSNS